MADKITLRALRAMIVVVSATAVTLTVPGPLVNLPDDIVINLDEQYRPITQRDAERCFWFHQMVTPALDAEAKLFLRKAWVRSTQFTVSYKAPVNMGKGVDSVWITKSTTIAEIFAGINKRARIIYSPVGTVVNVGTAAATVSV